MLRALVLASLAALSSAEVQQQVESALSIDLFAQTLDQTLTNWELGGDAEVIDSTVRLTADKQSQRGFIWLREPANILGHHWELDFQFRISGSGVSLFGDGLAFWYTKERFVDGPVFGHADKFTGLGVFFDTYDNAAGTHLRKHPYVSAMVNDGTQSYFDDDHNPRPEATDTGCHSRIRQYGAEEKVVTARMTYSDKTLTLKLLQGKAHSYTTKQPYEWTTCFTMNGVDIPPGYYFGASATTGDLSDSHEVLSLRLRPEQGGHEGQVPEEVKRAVAEQKQQATVASADAKPAPVSVAPKAGGPQAAEADSSVAVQQLQQTVDALSQGKAAAEQELEQARQKLKEETDAKLKATELAEALQRKVAQQDVDFERMKSELRTLQASNAETPKDVNALDFSEEKAAEWNNLLRNSDTFIHLRAGYTKLAAEQQSEARRNTERVQKLHEHLEGLMQKLQDRESNIEDRMRILSEKLQSKLGHVVHDSESASAGWMLPFIGLLVVLSGVALFAWMKFRALEKLHAY